jgi:glycosyltransferase involved in cell wall biosynthesis
VTQGSKRLTIVQYAGDFREASERLGKGGPETYRGQRYTVDYVHNLVGQVDSVTTITGFTAEAYDVTLAEGVRAIGAGFTNEFDGKAIANLVAQTSPDLLILRTPSRPVMYWAIRNRCRTLMLLADSFNEQSLRSRIGQRLLSFFMRFGVFEVVGNHGRSAARQLVSAGVAARKVVAWDFPAFDSPSDRAPKVKPNDARRIIFVGMLMAEKGVDDLVRAVKLLKDDGLVVKVDLIGNGDKDRLASIIEECSLQDAVEIVGSVPNSEIITRMAAADAVVIPSRHDYAEGLPLTIYEAYCSRTPLIVSDHPMFLENVIHEESGLVFRAGDPQDLAAQISRLFTTPDLYAMLSTQGLEAWERLQIPVKWGELISKWLEGSADSRSWLLRQSLDKA